MFCYRGVWRTPSVTASNVVIVLLMLLACGLESEDVETHEGEEAEGDDEDEAFGNGVAEGLEDAEV